MGKVATAAASGEMKRRKKKGRPSKTPPKSNNYNSATRRSTRRNPNLDSPPQPEFVDDDDDDERKEKKVKLVVRLPQSNDTTPKKRHSRSDSDSDSGPDSEPDEETDAKKRKINAVDHRSDDSVSDQEKKVLKATDTLHGSPLDSGPTTTPLPEQKLLVFILDRLQKKDTYGVFSEPVDPEELPDYHEIIERPMDFGTVRKKLGGVYKSLEELEADVFLICSNAMQYNAPDTVYFRQARSIQELARRDFENLKHEGDNGEPQPKVVRRGRPPSKNQKKSFDTSPVDRVDPEPSAGATPGIVEDKTIGSNSYNLRKAATFSRFRSTDPYMLYSSKNGENYSEWLADWNDEFPASILRADMKYGKKQFTVDENRRDTYRQFHPLSSGKEQYSSGSGGDMKRLIPVGIQEQFAYARSLARFAANLGPIAWKIASKKIESVLPAGVKFGPGWVGDSIPHSNQMPFSSKQKSSNSSTGDCHSSRLVVTSTSDLNSAVAYRPSAQAVEAVTRRNSPIRLTGQLDSSSWTPQLQAQQKSLHQSQRNGYSGMFSYDSYLLGSMRGAAKPEHSGQEDILGLAQTNETASKNDPPSSNPLATNFNILEETKLPGSWNNINPGCSSVQPLVSTVAETEGHNSGKLSWQALSMQQRQNLQIPPDLNVRVQVTSPSSSLQIGSPQQPDLALQL